ncbi:14680_t:CDS:2 [Funneliformis geosporum]|uniref:14680_t:CDS:1 n=1 Tax=Funneliformis geosporum TaxID=1117311 RepID=A0A9W4T434_9GLOM|nr:14680_t:CDS:2 [Funneliformis geosporum]
MLSEIKEAGLGFEYFLKTPCEDWDAVQYHKSWKDSNLGLDKASVIRRFNTQLRKIIAQGTEEEKKNAIRVEKQFQLPMELRLRMVMDFASATTATHGTSSSHGYGLRLRCWLQLPMELRLRMVMDFASALESKRGGRIDNFWLKSLHGLKCNHTENDKINAENVFVSCDLDGIQFGGSYNEMQFAGTGNNFQGHKRPYENREQTSVEEIKRNNDKALKRTKIEHYFHNRNDTSSSRETQHEQQSFGNMDNEEELPAITLIKPPGDIQNGYTTPSPCSPKSKNTAIELPMLDLQSKILVDIDNNPFLEESDVILSIDDIPGDLTFEDGNSADDFLIREINVSSLFRNYQNQSLKLARDKGLLVE